MSQHRTHLPGAPVHRLPAGGRAALVAAAILGVCLLGIAGFFALSSVRGEGSSAGPVISQATVPTDDPARTVEQLGQQTGFAVLAPSPGPGWKLTGAEATSGQGALARSQLNYQSVDAGGAVSSLQVVQFGIRLTHPANDTGTTLEPPAPGYDLTVSTSPNQAVYTLRSATRTFIVTIEGPAAADEAFARSAMKSLE